MKLILGIDEKEQIEESCNSVVEDIVDDLINTYKISPDDIYTYEPSILASATVMITDMLSWQFRKGFTAKLSLELADDIKEQIEQKRKDKDEQEEK